MVSYTHLNLLPNVTQGNKYRVLRDITQLHVTLFWCFTFFCYFGLQRNEGIMLTPLFCLWYLLVLTNFVFDKIYVTKYIQQQIIIKKIEFEAVSLLLTMINMAPFYMCTLYSFYKRLNRQMIQHKQPVFQPNNLQKFKGGEKL